MQVKDGAAGVMVQFARSSDRFALLNLDRDAVVVVLLVGAEVVTVEVGVGDEETEVVVTSAGILVRRHWIICCCRVAVALKHFPQ